MIKMVEDKIMDEEYLKGVDETLEMIPLTFDVVFKGMFETNLDLLKDFLISVLKLKVDYETTKIHLSNTELPKENVKEYQKRIDILVVINKKITVDIEVNRSKFEDSKERNTMYLDKINTLILEVGDKKIKLKDTILCQLNLNVIDKEYEEPDDVICLCSLKTNKIYQNNKFIFLKYLVKFREIYYNEDIEKTRGEIWLAALTAENFTELNEMLSHILTDEERCRFVRRAIKMSKSKINLAEWEAEKLNELVREKARESAMNEGIKVGEEKKLKETIINMLKKDIPANTISEITGKTVEEITSLKEQI